MKFVTDVAANSLANALVWVLFGLTALGLARLYGYRAFRFLGLDPRRIDESVIDIWVSNTYQGSAEKLGDVYMISLPESRAVDELNRFLGSAPLRLPEMVRGLVDGIWVSHSVSTRLSVSPLKEQQELSMGKASVVIGGANRNSIRRRLIMGGHVAGRLTAEAIDCPLEEAPRGGVVVAAPQGEVAIHSERQLALVEKVWIRTEQRTVFCCLGERADGCLKATRYLVENWRKLVREYHDGPFCLVLEVGREIPYSDEVDTRLIMKMSTAQ